MGLGTFKSSSSLLMSLTLLIKKSQKTCDSSCCGKIDGKHLVLEAPRSSFVSEKSVLLFLADSILEAKYCLLAFTITFDFTDFISFTKMSRRTLS